MKYLQLSVAAMAIFMASCGPQKQEEPKEMKTEPIQRNADEYLAEDFADIRVHRYFVNGWEELTLEQKKLLYYLNEAAQVGRDILWDQNYKHNLRVRKTIENILETYNGDKTTAEWNEFVVYCKRVFVANGIHHHYSMNKFKPGFDFAYFKTLVDNSSGEWPLLENETKEDLLALLEWVIFDTTKRNTNQTFESIKKQCENKNLTKETKTKT